MSHARLAARLFGTGNVLVIHRFTLDLVGGDHLAALFMEQLVYWSERTSNPDGWIVKTYAEWEDELRLSKYLVSRIVDTLKPFGVETTLRRSPFHKMQPVLHYRINLEALEVKLRTFIDSEEISLSNESEEISLSVSETTPEPSSDRDDLTDQQKAVRALAAFYQSKSGRLIGGWAHNDLVTLSEEFPLAQIESAIAQTGDRPLREPFAYLRRVLLNVKVLPPAPAKPAGFWGRDFTDGE